MSKDAQQAEQARKAAITGHATYGENIAKAPGQISPVVPGTEAANDDLGSKSMPELEALRTKLQAAHDRNKHAGSRAAYAERIRNIDKQIRGLKKQAAT